MSYTTVYRVPATGGIETAGEFSTSYGFGAFIWDTLARRRLGWEHWAAHGVDGCEPLWELAWNEGLPGHERIALAATFDRVMVRRENIRRVVAAFRAFVSSEFRADLATWDWSVSTGTCSVLARSGSLIAQTRLLNELAADPECFAVCWNVTSVENVWPRVCDDPETDDGRAYDVSIDTDHWFMFDELKGLGEPTSTDSSDRPTTS